MPEQHVALQQEGHPLHLGLLGPHRPVAGRHPLEKALLLGGQLGEVVRDIADGFLDVLV